jgi:hypothetical protein
VEDFLVNGGEASKINVIPESAQRSSGTAANANFGGLGGPGS